MFKVSFFMRKLLSGSVWKSVTHFLTFSHSFLLYPDNINGNIHASKREK